MNELLLGCTSTCIINCIAKISIILVFETLTGRPPERGVDHQETLDEVPRLLRHVLQLRMIEVHLTRDNVLLQLDRVPAVEWRHSSTGQHEHDHSQTPHVRLGTRIAALYHLWTGELWSATGGDGHVTLISQVIGQTEVNDLDVQIILVLVSEHNVVWLQI